MNALLRISAIVHKIVVANPDACYHNLLKAIESVKPMQPDIIVCPPLSLTGASCGSFLHNQSLLEANLSYLKKLQQATLSLESYLVVGIVASVGGVSSTKTCVLHHGELIHMLDSTDSACFQCGEVRFAIIGKDCKHLAKNAHLADQNNCDIILAPLFCPATAGSVANNRTVFKHLSEIFDCAIAVSNLGLGETSSPVLYQGFAGIYECGAELGFLCEASLSQDSIVVTQDIDIDIIRSHRNKHRPSNQNNIPTCIAASFPKNGDKSTILRPIQRNPYLPLESKEAYLMDLFMLSVKSLAIRLQNTGIQKLVIGISGGLDSTLALLTSAKAMDILALPRKNLIALTMPGFGTSGRTYQNAISLIQSLGATCQEISIKESVTLHLHEIGHHLLNKDVTYENAQARERTQILLDIANMEGGLVVGTGDLSEEALGFCTFAGDHISNYNVNVCFTKNMIRETVTLLAGTDTFDIISDTLHDILDTPVSPELLPPDESGGITQKTEELLGSYALHDFFLYHFIAYGFSPKKIVTYAMLAFPEFEKPYIQEKLALFYRRFFGGQFKRSCTPDCASITKFNLTNAQFSMPSDCSSAFFIDNINS